MCYLTDRLVVIFNSNQKWEPEAQEADTERGKEYIAERLLHSGSFSPTVGGHSHPRGEEAEAGQVCRPAWVLSAMCSRPGWVSGTSSATEADVVWLNFAVEDLRV